MKALQYEEQLQTSDVRTKNKSNILQVPLLGFLLPVFLQLHLEGFLI